MSENGTWRFDREISSQKEDHPAIIRISGGQESKIFHVTYPFPEAEKDVDLTVLWTSGGIVYIGFDKDRAIKNATRFGGSAVHAPEEGAEIARHLIAFWKGNEKNILMPLLAQGTDFQLAIWRALQHIPAGYVTSYAALADFIGKPRAVRAVGQAVGANPHSLIVPCHRVVRADGALSGYLWGTELKKKILDVEARYFGVD